MATLSKAEEDSWLTIFDSLGEWDLWYIRQVNAIFATEILGQQSASRVLTKEVSQLKMQPEPVMAEGPSDREQLLKDKPVSNVETLDRQLRDKLSEVEGEVTKIKNALDAQRLSEARKLEREKEAAEISSRLAAAMPRETEPEVLPVAPPKGSPRWDVPEENVQATCERRGSPRSLALSPNRMWRPLP